MFEASAGTTGIPEYDGNPFINAIPGPKSIADIHKSLSAPPIFSPAERKLPHHIRRELLWRLTRFMEPLPLQIDLAAKVGTVIRNGYVGRNPADGEHHQHVLACAERTAAGSLTANVTRRPVVHSSGFALTGCSGMGKSVSIERILQLFPQVVIHPTGPLSRQIVWMKLDCPYKGSEKNLCVNFFNQVDELVGTEYLRDFGKIGNPNERMMIDMARVAQLHALGVLVIDEIQHARQAKGGARVFLNFLVTLVNTIGIPVIVVGTMGATTVIQDNFREARRATACGSPVWEPLQRGPAWDYFLNSLWRYQWIREPEDVPCPEVSEALFDESQGIIDIVVRLFMLSQWRIITASELRGARERLTAPLIRSVASEDMKVIQPMIRALRNNDTHALEIYDDLRPFHVHVARVMGRDLTVDDLAAMRTPSPAVHPTASDDPDAPVRAFLISAGHADDVVDTLISKAREQEPSGDPHRVLDSIREMLAAGAAPKPRKPRLVRASPVEGDLRAIVQAGRAKDLSAHAALADARLVRRVSDALAA